ncbi:MAG: hypothetical protein ABI659_02125, partial [Nitrosospira sp.]
TCMMIHEIQLLKEPLNKSSAERVAVIRQKNIDGNARNQFKQSRRDRSVSVGRLVKSMRNSISPG